MEENLSEYSLEKLKNAFSKLSEGAKIADDDLYRDGVIQRFEFTFEQSWKVMKLYLENQGIVDEALAPRSTIRIAFSHKVILDGDVWIDMMLDRNRTSHMYDEEVAKEIVNNIKNVYIHEFNLLKKFLEN